MTPIVPLPLRNPSFVPWWTIAGFIASTAFGIGLVESFMGEGEEMTAEQVIWITAGMVALWILIPGVCYVIAHRFYLGMEADEGRKVFLLYRRKGSRPVELSFDSVRSVRADDEEYDERMAAEAETDAARGTQAARPGQGIGVTNRPLHHNLLVRTDAGLFTIECLSLQIAEDAATKAHAVLARAGVSLPKERE